jgi:uncharacterized protein (DUF58 family)
LRPGSLWRGPGGVLRRPRSPGRSRGASPLLDDETARQLELLSLDRLEAVLAGLGGTHSGLARSRYPDFAGYRGYEQGDDPRLIDWNAYARLDELHVRVSVAPQPLKLVLLLDCSRSMTTAPPRRARSKLRYAQQLAAVLGTVGLLHGDPVCICALGDGQAWPSPPLVGRHALGTLLECLESLPLCRMTSLPGSIRSASRNNTDRTIAVLLSDLLMPREDDAALDWLGPAGAVIHLDSPADGEMPAGRHLELRDSETGHVITVTAATEMLQRYRTLAGARSAELAARCASGGLRYIRVDPATPVLDLVFGALCAQGVLQAGIVQEG